jgi:hypothetical protein
MRRSWSGNKKWKGHTSESLASKSAMPFSENLPCGNVRFRKVFALGKIIVEL